MPDLLIRNADVVATMDATRRELTKADILIRDGVRQQPHRHCSAGHARAPDW